MNIFFFKGKLKIIEQIILVVLVAVFVPLTICGFIINNINQQAVRAQLRGTALIIANTVSDSIDVFQNSINYELKQIGVTLDCFKTKEEKVQYLKKITKEGSLYEKIIVLNSEAEYIAYRKKAAVLNKATFGVRQKDGSYITGIFEIEKLKTKTFTSIGNDTRQIYILTGDGRLLTSFNYDKQMFDDCLKQLPKKLEEDIAVKYGKKKNQPFVYLKKSNPNILIIVTTPKQMTFDYIDYSRIKIILSVLCAALAVWFIVGLYTSYLYVNIRQLFKAIMAISKGNYKRRIRLLIHLFTPYEIIFLASEFNRMANQIHKSYLKLEKNNKELKELNEFRSNMIDTVSHEFRTPLTSIQGYTSRLLRQDIQIDDATKQKSLKIIKKQSERLKRMIEDLLVIPDIEGAHLNVNIEPVNINKIVTDAVILAQRDNSKTIINNISEEIPDILADKDRFEQVVINIVENAVKYADEDSEIIIEAENFDEQYVKLSVKNKCNVIPKDKLKNLFDKFTRMDDKTTRTTRGTGLGLFIVKGLIEAMNGHIHLHSGVDWGFMVQIFMKKVQDEESN